MSQYVILIYEEEASRESADPDTLDAVMRGHMAFGETHHGVIRGGNALQPTGTATSLRRDQGGAVTVTDGPFAETKEALAGFYLVEAADLDEALAVARDVPSPFGTVEVRPVRVIG